MRLLSLDLIDFMSHSVTAIDFTQVPACIITGPNGAGKSSLIDGIAWVLWGQTRASTDDVVRLGRTSAGGVVVIEVGSDRYRVSRTRKIAARGSSTLEFEIADVLTDSGWRSLAGANLRDTESRVEALVGPYDLACATWLSRQGQADQFARATPGERRQVLGRLLGLDRWARYREAAREQGRTDQAKLDAQAPRRADLEALAAKRPERLCAWTDARAVHQVAQDAHVQTGIEVADAEVTANDMRVSHAQIREARVRLEAASSALAAATQRRDRRATEIRTLETDLDLGGLNETWSPIDEAALTEARGSESSATIEMDEARARGEAAAESKRAAERDVEAAQRRLDDAVAQAREAWQTERSERAEGLRVAEAQLTSTREQHAKADRAIADYLGKCREDWQRSRGEAQTSVARTTSAFELASQAVSTAEREVRIAEMDAGLLGNVPCGGEGTFASCQFLTRATQSKTGLPALQEAVTTARGAAMARASELEAATNAVAALGDRAPSDVPEDLSRAVTEAQEAVDAAGVARQQAADRLAQIGTTAPAPDETTLSVLNAGLTAMRTTLEAASGERDSAAAAYRDANSRLQTARQRIADLEARKGRTAEAARREADQRAALEVMRTELRNDEAEVVRLVADQDAVTPAAQATRDLVAELQAAESAVRAATARRDEAVREVAQAEVAVREAERLVQEAERAEKALQDLDGETAEARKRVADLAMLGQAYADVPQLIVETVVPDIEGTANRLLARVSQTGLSISIRTQRALKSEKDRLAETLDLVVRDIAGERPYESYSGGERFRVDWALRVALAHVLSARAGLDLRTLVIDEGFGSLDPAGITGFASTLSATAEMFGLCLVISHVPELAEAFPKRLDVRKTAAGSVATWLD